MYKFKEIYYTIQGEGYHTGRPAVFCRFSGCNLWSGLEKDREHAMCKFCDTDFWGMDGENGGKYEINRLIEKIFELWPMSNELPFVVFTGGEPALQMDKELVKSLRTKGIYISVETNGTLELPEVDWVTVSPKADAELVLTRGNELKLVFPQQENHPKDFEHLNFDHFYLQPLDDNNTDTNQSLTVNYCLENPKWKLSLQTHKLLGIK